MKTLRLVIATGAVVGVVSAQDVTDIPKCAIPCFTSSISSTGCDLTDFTCQCQPSTQNSLRAAVTPCILSSCSPDDQLTVLKVTYAICQAHGGAVGSVTTVPGFPHSDIDILATAFPQALGSAAPSGANSPGATGGAGAGQSSGSGGGSATGAAAPMNTGAAVQVGASLGAVAVAAVAFAL